MNAPLPPDIAAFLADAAQEFREAMADEYQRDQIAAGQSMHADEPGYSIEETK